MHHNPNLIGSNKDFNWNKYVNQKDHFFDIYKLEKMKR